MIENEKDTFHESTINSLTILCSTTDPAYFPGRAANILYNGKVIGQMGVIHPEVLQKFEITNPCAALEINLEVFL